MFPLWNEISYTNTCCSWAWVQFITEICIKMILKELHTLWACLYAAFLRKQIHNQNKCPCLSLPLMLLQEKWKKCGTAVCSLISKEPRVAFRSRGPPTILLKQRPTIRLLYREDREQMHITQVICTSLQPVWEKKKNPTASYMAAESVVGHWVWGKKEVF